MTQLSDVPSLRSLTRADSLLADIFASNFMKVLPSVLANSMPRDLQEIVFTMISIHDAAPFKDAQLPAVLENVRFDKQKRLFQLALRPTNPLKTLHRVSRTMTAIHFFTALWPEVFALRHQDFKDVRLNSVEIHRLHRGLWRFEVCCALVEAWKPSGDADPDSARLGADTRVPRLTQYLGRFMPWEFEEVASVYEYLELAVLDCGSSAPFAYLPQDLFNFFGHNRCKRARGCGELIGPISRDSWGHKYNIDRVLIAGEVGSLFAPLGQAGQNEYNMEAATRIRILSQGLVFLRAFQRLPCAAKPFIESKLQGCCLGDEFFYAAICSLIAWEPRFPLVEERQITASHGLWNETDDYKADPNFVEGTDTANDRWDSYTRGHFPTWCCDRSGLFYPPHAKFRSWGYSIWSRPRGCTNTRQRDYLECLEDGICECHSCMDDWD